MSINFFIKESVIRLTYLNEQITEKMKKYAKDDRFCFQKNDTSYNRKEKIICNRKPVQALKMDKSKKRTHTEYRR